MARLQSLDSAGIPYRWIGLSAIERYLGHPRSRFAFVAVRANLAEFAAYFDELEFPGLYDWDVVVRQSERVVFVRLVDEEPTHSPGGEQSVTGVSHDMDWHTGPQEHPLLQFAFEPATDRFIDPAGAYEWLRRARKDTDVPIPGPAGSLVAEAVITARFPFVWRDGTPAIDPAGTRTDVERGSSPAGGQQWGHRLDVEAPVFHRMALSLVLTGKHAWRGLDVLMNGGFLAQVVPELMSMKGTEHSKEGHPEGNVWRHTLETFRYRKGTELTISLALLFHDAGKPEAVPVGNRRFDRHADIGARLARRVLNRLGFDSAIIESVQWLVRYHMVPGAIERLPAHRRNPIMGSPLFPSLLEVYRCDLSSTFRGPDGYYRACKVYRRFLKNNGNPFRTADGKKAVQTYVA